MYLVTATVTFQGAQTRPSLCVRSLLHNLNFPLSPPDSMPSIVFSDGF